MPKTIEHNHLNVNGFAVEFVRIPFLKYSCQSVTIPSVQFSPVEKPTPFQIVHHPGDHLVYDTLSITFIIDENFNNYNTLYYWMQGLAFPEKFEQFVNFVEGMGVEGIETFTQNPKLNQFSDVKVIFLTNHKNPNIIYTFKDAFPVSLSGFEVTSTNSSSEIITATVEMTYTGLEINNES